MSETAPLPTSDPETKPTPVPALPVRPEIHSAQSLVARATGHRPLHHDVLRTMGGAAGGAFLAEVVGWLAGQGGAGGLSFAMMTLAGALAGLAYRPGGSPRSGLLAGALGGLGALAASLATAWTPFAAALLGAFAAPVVGSGERPKRMALSGLFAGAFAFAGLQVGAVVLETGLFLPLVPAPLAAAGAGAVVGLFVGLSSAPRHLLPARDPIEEAFDDALALRDGELHELLTRALGQYVGLRAALPSTRESGPTAARVSTEVRGQLLRVLRIAEDCRRLDDQLAREDRQALDGRIEELRAREASTLDETARRTYAEARGTLEEQGRALERIERGRERVLAKLHANLALLEKLRLALVQLESAHAERRDAESAVVVETLDELGRELDITANAVSEVFAAPMAPPALSPRV
ncbi:MAG: hypothetical protein AAFZ18_25310 [Myxococcota bacterium]